MGPDGGEAPRKGPRVVINNSLDIKPLEISQGNLCDSVQIRWLI
jgi:hypothetical protein